MKTNKIQLNESGYIFDVKGLRGRFGNILYVIENILLLAKNTKSKSILRNSKHKYDNLPISYPLIFDFTSEDSDNCLKIINDKFLFVFKHLYDNSLFIDKDNSCLKLVKNMLKIDYNKFSVGDNDLIVNIRGSRDIFKKKRINKKYVQPPLSYYTDIIDNNSYDKIIITTDSTKYNPVVRSLASKYDSTIIDKDFYDQVGLILRAKNLITTRSTFSLFLSRIGEELKNIYVWNDRSAEWSNFSPTPNNCLSHNPSIINYSCDDYTKSGEWSASEDQIKLMMSLPAKAFCKEKI